MMRRFFPAALALLLAAPLAAQAPAGWQMRLDRSTNAADPDDVPDVSVMTMGDGFHVTTGPAVVMWNSENTAQGTYTLGGRFTLLEPSGHVNYYGLVFGGRDLDASSQNYLYFLVGQNGTFILNHRANDENVHRIVGRTPHDAVRQPGDDGRSVNDLEVRVGQDTIELVVNGTVVHTEPRAGMAARTDGIWGVRINHQLNVQVDDVGVSR